MNKSTVCLQFSDGSKTVELPVYAGNLGPSVIDIGKLYAVSGKLAYDPGFMSTASCNSRITYVDGDRGELLYRGYPIEQLARELEFLDIAYLLLNAELPSAAEKSTFQRSVVNSMILNEQVQHLLRGFPHDAHPMAILISLTAALAVFYPVHTTDYHDGQARKGIMTRLLAQIPTLIAMIYRHCVGEGFAASREGLSYTANFFHMMFASPDKPFVINPLLVQALNRIFILHADHEQNASTATVRLAGSSETNLYAAISSGVACLWGASHGGANEACLNMLIDLERQGGVEHIGQFIAKVKEKTSGVRLMGFGHRIYKSYDPRAKLMRETCYEVLRELNVQNEPLFALALKLEQIALEDEYFVTRKLYPNVDFYSGIIQRALGIPAKMFTCIFALARTAGWLAQWEEMISDPECKIGRPRQLYLGSVRRELHT